MKVIYSNKRAFYDYEVISEYISGISLKGWEVKSIKSFHIDISNAFVKELNGELFLVNSKVSLNKALLFKENQQIDRYRKLLLKKNEIKQILQLIKTKKGTTVIPLEVFVNSNGFIKVKIGVCKGKKKYDKREIIKKRDIEKQIRSFSI